MACVLVSVTLLVVYVPVLSSLVRQWASDENYSHGFVIVPLALFFAWERRRALARTPAAPSTAGLVVVAGSLLVFLAGLFGAEIFLSRVSLIGVLAGAILFLFGWRHLRLLAFPVLFLLLMVPLPAILFNHLTLPLQSIASRAGEAAIAAAGIPVLREGNVLVLPTTTLEVAQACSGIRSLISLLTIAIVLGYFREPRRWARGLLAAATIPIAIVANAARVAGTGLAADWIGPEAAEGFFHAFSGWLVFLAAFGLLLVVQQALARRWRVPARRRAVVEAS